MNNRTTIWRLFADDEGYTSLAVVLAAALALVLALSASQIIWTNSRSSTVQHVADAAALAGENVVAKYMTIARVADAVILSLGLCGTLLLATATIVACIPYANTFAEPLFEAGKQVLTTRNDVSESAAKTLSKMQKALPLLTQMNASAVTGDNAKDLSSDGMHVAVLPFPLKGKDLVVDSLTVDTNAIEQTNKETMEISKETEKYDEQKKRSLEAAFRADCVDDPACLQERANTLAHMDGADNPRYSSSENWTFAVPLKRAQKYYQQRYLQEVAPALGVSDEEAAKAFARKEFYSIAIEELSKGRAPEGEASGGEIYLPVLPKNTEDMRQRAIYTQQRFPVSTTQGARLLHYSSQCSGYQNGVASGVGALADIDRHAVGECPLCRFSIGTLGATPAASTSIDNGFEHYYRIIALESQKYSEANEHEDELLGKAAEKADALKPLFKDVLKKLVGYRIDPSPPGINGCVAVLIDSSHPKSPLSLGKPSEVPTCIALSAAVLADLPRPADDSVLTNAFASITGKTGAEGSGTIGQKALDLLSSILVGYGKGVENVEESIGGLLSKIPGVSDSTGHTWGKRFVSEVLDDTGLQPAELTIPRAVLANTETVFATDKEYGARFALIQKNYLSIPGEGTNDPVETLVSLVDSAAQALEEEGIQALQQDYTIASIDLFGLDIPLKVSLPETAVENGRKLLGQARASLSNAVRSAAEPYVGWRAWQ